MEEEPKEKIEPSEKRLKPEKSRWFFAPKYYEDQKEKERLKEVDYKHWKLNNF